MNYLIWNDDFYVKNYLIDSEDVKTETVEDDEEFEVEVYTYWDGHNMVRVEKSEEMVEYCVRVTDDFVDLDEWDGRNMVTGGLGLHQSVHKVIELDEEKPTDTYLLIYQSQFENAHDKAELMTIEQLMTHLGELGRDKDAYMEELKQLG